MSVFSDNLKRYRVAAGFATAKEFAQTLKIPYNTYLNYETKNYEPKYDILCKIADVLNVTTDELLGHQRKTPNIPTSLPNPNNLPNGSVLEEVREATICTSRALDMLAKTIEKLQTTL